MEQRMTLSNKDHPVLQVLYDNELHAITRILEIQNLRYAPPAILDHKGMPNRGSLNEWWRDRAIPTSRNHLRDDFPYLDDTRTLVEQSMGLSLSDRYWMHDSETNLQWKDVNFFDNPFSEDLGLITLGQRQQSHDSSEDMCSPNATLGGDLRKKWTIREGARILLKSGSGPFQQEPYNEAIATALHERLLEPGDFVPYTLERHHCACPNMLGQDEELVPMWDIVANHKKPNHLNDFTFCLALCGELGISRDKACTAYEKMFTCDAILANKDRHYRNFGIIRDVESLRYTRVAPIYDTGACLWHDRIELSGLEDYEYMAKPFGRNGMEPMKQLALFHGFKWFDESRLKGFTEEASELLKRNPLMPDKRRDAVIRGLEKNIKEVACYIREEKRDKSKTVSVPQQKPINRQVEVSDEIQGYLDEQQSLDNSKRNTGEDPLPKRQVKCGSVQKNQNDDPCKMPYG